MSQTSDKKDSLDDVKSITSDTSTLKAESVSSNQTIESPHLIQTTMPVTPTYSSSLPSIEAFIKEKGYHFVIDEWFYDLWYFVYNELDVIITKPILSFIFKTKNEILSHDLFKSYREKYQAYLKQSKIEFELLKYDPDLIQSYPMLKNDILLSSNPTKKTWVKVPFLGFKESILLLSNIESKEIRQTLILFEKILSDYNKATLHLKTEALELEFQAKLSLKEKENEELKNRVAIINDMVIQRGNIQRTQIFYIATSHLYAYQNIFKIGGVENRSLIKTRFNTYNTERPKDDSFFYIALFECHDYRLVEHLLSSFLSNFRLPNKKELFKINIDDLNRIVNLFISQLDEYISYFNSTQASLIDNLIYVKDLKEDLSIRNQESSVWLSIKNLTNTRKFVVQSASLEINKNEK